MNPENQPNYPKQPTSKGNFKAFMGGVASIGAGLASVGEGIFRMFDLSVQSYQAPKPPDQTHDYLAGAWRDIAEDWNAIRGDFLNAAEDLNATGPPTNPTETEE